LNFALKERRLGATPNTQPNEEKDISEPKKGSSASVADTFYIAGIEQFLCHIPLKRIVHEVRQADPAWSLFLDVKLRTH
jgi:hypothetical protein